MEKKIRQNLDFNKIIQINDITNQTDYMHLQIQYLEKSALQYFAKKTWLEPNHKDSSEMSVSKNKWKEELGDVAQLIEYSPGRHKSWLPSPALYKLDKTLQACNPNTILQKGYKFKVTFRYKEFEASLGYTRPCLKKQQGQ